MSLRSRTPKNRIIPTVIAAGAIGTVALGLATTGTMSAFAASIQNTTNSAGTGTLVLQEQNSDKTVTCTSTDDNATNAATCATINKYGGETLVPGGSTTTTVTMTNLGTVTPASFTLAPGACTQTGTVPAGDPGDLCTKINLAVYADSDATGTAIYNGTLDAFTTAGAQTLDALAPQASQDYTFVVSLPSDLEDANTFQGLTASQPLTWTMSS